MQSLKPITPYILWRRLILETTFRKSVTLPVLVKLMEEAQLITLNETFGGLECLPTQPLTLKTVTPVLEKHLKRSWFSRWLYRQHAAQQWDK